jgi:hypothetical protein
MEISFKRPRQRMFVYPQAGLLSQGLEMTQNIQRGQWKYPKNPSGRKASKVFVKDIMTNPVGMEFPTAKMFKGGVSEKFNIGLGSFKPTSFKPVKFKTSGFKMSKNPFGKSKKGWMI